MMHTALHDGASDVALSHTGDLPTIPEDRPLPDSDGLPRADITQATAASATGPGRSGGNPLAPTLTSPLQSTARKSKRAFEDLSAVAPESSMRTKERSSNHKSAMEFASAVSSMYEATTTFTTASQSGYSVDSRADSSPPVPSSFDAGAAAVAGVYPFRESIYPGMDGSQEMSQAYRRRRLNNSGFSVRQPRAADYLCSLCDGSYQVRCVLKRQYILHSSGRLVALVPVCHVTSDLSAVLAAAFTQFGWSCAKCCYSDCGCVVYRCWYRTTPGGPSTRTSAPTATPCKCRVSTSMRQPTLSPWIPTSPLSTQRGAISTARRVSTSVTCLPATMIAVVT
jgi:hypothetical protein